MPNRIIKDTIRTSEKINELSDFNFRLWTYLLTYVDDYGRGIAKPEIIKGFCFSLRDNVTKKHIAEGLAELESIGLIYLYEVDGKLYLCFPTWGDHQRIQNKQSKCPAPEEGNPVKTEQSIGKISFSVSHGSSRCLTVAHGELPPESNTNTKKNPSMNPNISAEQSDDSPAQELCFEDLPSQLEPLPLNDGSEWTASIYEYNEYVRLFPAVDVAGEFRRMRAWLLSNPSKRKTRRGITRFAANWLGRNQDSGGSKTVKASGGAANRFHNFEAREIDYDAIAKQRIEDRNRKMGVG